ncbi:MAG: GNAT family N-acetyltransferase [Phototrophicales bacterium]|nr:GNAT family N-acetyltransferase [Phototrophicales bacterium]
MFIAKLGDVRLMPMADDHAVALFNIVRNDRRYLAKWQNWPRTLLSLDDMYRMIEHSDLKISQNNGFDSTIFYRGQIVGKIGLVYITRETHTTEIGYWQAKNAQGKGIMTRAAHIVTSFALITMGLERVYIRCAEANVRSAAIPVRLGYTYEGVLPEQVWIHKKFYSEVRFVMTAKTWLTQKMIYHITTRAEWDEAQKVGAYRAPSLESQGFIHASSISQVIKVANAVYVGQKNLVLLAIDVRHIIAPMRYEPPDTSILAEQYEGELFPHIYGELNLSAVLRVDELPCGDDGLFALPAYLDK